MSTYTVSTWVGDEDKGTYRECVVEFDYTPGDPGQTSGPPERCYEPTGAEVEIVSVLVDGLPWPISADEEHELAERLYDVGDAKLREENDFARDGHAADAQLWRD
jgi:hypothetical protein